MRFPKFAGRGFRLAHVVWALLAASLSVLLVVAEGGHPPPIVFLPVVVVAWGLGHAALWGIGKLAARGREAATKAGGAVGAWPPGLIVALIGTGLVACVGLVQIGGSLLLGEWYPFAGALWALALAASLAHGAGLVGLLLRRPWSRPMTALLSIGWALWLVWLFSEALVLGQRINPADYVILVVGVSLLCFFGYHILSSRRIRAFLGSDSGPLT